jgi:hypothetical protein
MLDAKVVVKFLWFFIGFDDEIDLCFMDEDGWETMGKDFSPGLDFPFIGILMTLLRNT